MFAAASFPYSKHEQMTPERHARVEIVCLCTGEPWECSGRYVMPGGPRARRHRRADVASVARGWGSPGPAVPRTVRG